MARIDNFKNTGTSLNNILNAEIPFETITNINIPEIRKKTLSKYFL